RSFEQPHVVCRKAPLQQRLDRTLQKIRATESLDTLLSILPRLLELGLIGIGWAGDLLNEDTRPSHIVRRQQEACGQLLRGRKVPFQRICQGASAERHYSLVARIALISLDRDGNASRSAH